MKKEVRKMSYCPIIKDKCPKNRDDCEFWEEEKIHEGCKDGGCEGQGWDCDACPRMHYWITGSGCALKGNVKGDEKS